MQSRPRLRFAQRSVVYGPQSKAFLGRAGLSLQQLQIPAHLTEFPATLDGAVWRECALFLPELMCVVFSPVGTGGWLEAGPLRA